MFTNLFDRRSDRGPLPTVEAYWWGFETLCMLISQDWVSWHRYAAESVVITINRTTLIAMKPGSVGPERNKECEGDSLSFQNDIA